MVEQNSLNNSRPFERITYEDLNDALCRAIFTPDMSNRPVYLELTAEVIDQVSNELGVEPDLLEDLIFESVNSKLQRSNQQKLFDSITGEIVNWLKQSRRSVEADGEVLNYPHIPLLLAFTIAASDMGSDGGFAPNAYYARLQGILGLDDKKNLEESYRDVAIYIWSSWNEWLDKLLNGKRGIGTAYSISTYRYVGLALSQALVRSVDRKKFPRLFKENDLAPFDAISEQDMIVLLDEWMNRDESHWRSNINPSTPLKKLWEKEAARVRISNIACQELALWDGSIQRGQLDEEELTKNDFTVRLVAFETSFPTSKMNFKFSFSAPHDLELDSTVELIVSQNSPSISLPISRDQTGWWHLEDTSVEPISALDMLEGLLELNVGQDFNIDRAPKSLVVFRHDELSRKYLEVEYAEIGIRSLIAVRDSDGIVNQVSKILEECARVGWMMMTHSSTNGIPIGWVVFKNVQFVTRPDESYFDSTNSPLSALRPNLKKTLQFQDGFQLPGLPQKFHSGVGFEIVASILGAPRITIRIIDSDTTQNVVSERSFETSMGIWQMAPSELAPGDYLVQVFGDSDEVPYTKTLRLRSSDYTKEGKRLRSQRLIHDFTDSTMGALHATPLIESSSTYADGAITVKCDDSTYFLDESNISSSIWWTDKVEDDFQKEDFQQIKLQGGISSKCSNNGEHRFEYPIWQQRDDYILGVCRYCGQTEKGAADIWASEIAKVQRRSARLNWILQAENLSLEYKIEPKQFTPISEKKIHHLELLDGIMYTESGSGSQLDSLASVVDPTALFRHQVHRELDQLAMVDFKLDDNFQISSWEVTPTCIVSCGYNGRDKVITGFVSKSILESISKLIASGKVVGHQKEENFTLPRIIGASEGDLQKVSTELNIPYATNSTLDILKLLPPIVSLVQLLPTKAVPGFEFAERYFPNSNVWLNTMNIERAGGYKLKNDYRSIYIVRTEDDLSDNSARFASFEFTKHYQAALQGTPLMAYDSNKQHLIVPLGANLPGLYGRACVLASGRLPNRDTTGRHLIYTNIEMKVARLIFAKFGGAVDE